MIRPNRARWALSFADLSLLLLGFFVLLQANRAQRDTALAGLGTYFGAIRAPIRTDLAARALFEPGEALLSEAGRAALLRAAGPFARSKEIIQIQSIGVDAGETRFDAWDPDTRSEGTAATVTERDWIGGFTYILHPSGVWLQMNYVRKTFGGVSPARNVVMTNVQTAW